MHNQEEWELISNLATKDDINTLHIGLHNKNYEGWEWTDGSELDYKPWLEGQPTDVLEKKQK